MHQPQHALRSALAALRGPQLLVLALALGLAFAWFGPAALALGLPFALMLIPRRIATGGRKRRHSAAPGQMADMAATLEHRLRAARRARHPVLCITLAIPGFDGLSPALGDRLVTTCLDRLSHGLRQEDALFGLGGGRFGVVPDGARGIDAAAARRLATRLESHAAAGLSGIRGAENLSVASGFCLETQPGARGARAVIADSLAATGPPPAPAGG
ncbi:hypothetical protein [Roseovarius ramblicola]|uniref:GGDEF domain-containing protein n=1 Tax=Roseovarius ramblicola TaxID=2022336 RepID=A0ABV5I1X8_9RHOB